MRKKISSLLTFENQPVCFTLNGSAMSPDSSLINAILKTVLISVVSEFLVPMFGHFPGLEWRKQLIERNINPTPICYSRINVL